MFRAENDQRIRMLLKSDNTVEVVPDEKRKVGRGRKAVINSLYADKRALSRAIIITLIEAAITALLPFGQKLLLENPSILTATLATTFSVLQVFFLMLFFDLKDTLGAAMEKDLNLKVFLPMESMSKQHLTWIKKTFGQLHSSMTNKLVIGFGSNLPTALKDVAIVIAQLIGISIAFGPGSFLGLTLLGLMLMATLVAFAFKWNKRFSSKQKILDAQQNKHFEDYTEQLSVHQSSGSSWIKFRLLEKVLDRRIALFQSSELRRALLIGAPRFVPQYICMWSIYVLAVSEGRSPAELAMLSGYVGTTMVVSYTGFQTLLYIAESHGDLYHLGEFLSSSDRDPENQRPRGERPQGEQVIDRVKRLSLSADTRVELPNGQTLFANGLFPRHRYMNELCIRKDEFVVLIGRKGCGKTTVANILGRHYENNATDLVQWSGTYRINEWDVFGTTLHSFYRRIFYGPQTANQVDGLREDLDGNPLLGTVRDNIGLFLHHQELNLNLTPEEEENWVKQAATIVGLGKKLDQEVATLSGGERALCMLGRGVLGMILGELNVLILDEPFAHLDDASGREMVNKLYSLAKQYSCTLVIISHKDSFNPPDATAFVFGDDGDGIVEWGTVHNLRRQRKSQYNQVLRASYSTPKSYTLIGIAMGVIGWGVYRSIKDK